MEWQFSHLSKKHNYTLIAFSHLSNTFGTMFIHILTCSDWYTHSIAEHKYCEVKIIYYFHLYNGHIFDQEHHQGVSINIWLQYIVDSIYQIYFMGVSVRWKSSIHWIWAGIQPKSPKIGCNLTEPSPSSTQMLQEFIYIILWHISIYSK